MGTQVLTCGLSDIVCVVAGVTSDANVLIDYARLACQRYEYAYGEPMPVEQLVQAICNQKQRYTQHGGMRPFGTAFLFAGWDKFYGYQLYQSDPSGNYGGWKATCIGSNSGPAQSTFKADYPEEGLVLADAKKLLVKVLGKTMETTVLTGDKRTPLSAWGCDSLLICSGDYRSAEISRQHDHPQPRAIRRRGAPHQTDQGNHGGLAPNIITIIMLIIVIMLMRAAAAANTVYNAPQ